MAGDEKFVWPSQLVEWFLEICVDEKRNGHFVGGLFNDPGKANLMRRMNEKIFPKTLSAQQFWTKWDLLKGDLRGWKELKHAASGLGWVNGSTISASEEWWKARLQGKPKLKKFKKKPLEHEELLELFADSIATGFHARTPAAYLYPQNEPAPEHEADNAFSNDQPGDTPYHLDMDEVLQNSANVMDNQSNNEEDGNAPPVVTPPPAASQPNPLIRGFPQPMSRKIGDKRKGKVVV